MVARAGGAVLNILLSGLFIFGFDMGVAGAASARRSRRDSSRSCWAGG